MSGEIVLIGGDKQLVDCARQALDAEGGRLAWAAPGPKALRRADERSTELVILAIRPAERGWDLLRRLLAALEVPLLVLVMGGDEVDRVRGLEIGADDCASWPLSGPELAARAQALLRGAVRRARRRSGYLADGELVIDLSRREVWRDGEPVALTATELRVLACFVRHVGEVVSQQRLAAEVWAPVRAGKGHRVYPYIRSLRCKLEDDPSRPQRIVTRHGQGYQFLPLSKGR